MAAAALKFETEEMRSKFKADKINEEDVIESMTIDQVEENEVAPEWANEELSPVNEKTNILLEVLILSKFNRGF